MILSLFGSLWLIIPLVLLALTGQNSGAFPDQTRISWWWAIPMIATVWFGRSALYLFAHWAARRFL